jgi:hypothetical protein
LEIAIIFDSESSPKNMSEFLGKRRKGEIRGFGWVKNGVANVSNAPELK